MPLSPFLGDFGVRMSQPAAGELHVVPTSIYGRTVVDLPPQEAAQLPPSVIRVRADIIGHARINM